MLIKADSSACLPPRRDTGEPEKILRFFLILWAHYIYIKSLISIHVLSYVNVSVKHASLWLLHHVIISIIFKRVHLTRAWKPEENNKNIMKNKKLKVFIYPI